MPGISSQQTFLNTIGTNSDPGCLYLMSMYYRRYELQKRFTFFFCSAILAGAFSGVCPFEFDRAINCAKFAQLLAYAIANMAGIGGYNGWRWIFIVEGLLTVIAAAIAKFFIADWPEDAKFLNAQERILLRRRLAEDGEEGRMDRLDRKAKIRVFTDWKIYLGFVFPWS